MAITYYLTNTASDLSTPTGVHWNNALNETAPGASNISNTVSNTGTPPNDVEYAYTPSGDPGTDGSTGTYTVTVVPNTTDADALLFIQLHRINSAGTVQQSSTLSAGQTMTATRTYTFSSLDLGTWAAGDRLRVDFSQEGTGAHGNATFDYAIGSTGTRIDTPWTRATPSPRAIIIS
jgi:hypothetical protein